MSRNFELLQRAEREQELLGASRSAMPPTDGNYLPLKLEGLAEQEAVKLVQRVFLLPSPDSPRVVVFSGVRHGDGCSFVCACAAEILATQMAGSFCLVDANVRTPSLHRYFGVKNGVGLAEALAQSGPIRNFTQQIAGSNLWVLTCGSATSNFHALLNCDNLRTRIADLRAEFDNVLIDTPPLNLYAEAITLGRLSDGIVLVLQSNSTRREVARKAKESLEAAKVRLLGAVLNQRTFPIPAVLYKKL